MHHTEDRNERRTFIEIRYNQYISHRGSGRLPVAGHRVGRDAACVLPGTSLYNSDYGTVGVKGRIVNETDKEISMIYVTTVFFDKEGKVLGISGTTVTDITANDKTSFDDPGMFMEKFSVDQVDHYKVYADEMYLQF